MSTNERRITFKMIGGPHDGDSVPMPVSSIPRSKSMVLQSNNEQLGILHQYYFNRKLRTAKYEGVVKVAKDSQ